jgi:hypothetical protein
VDNKWYSLSYFSEIFNVIISTAREDTYTLLFLETDLNQLTPGVYKLYWTTASKVPLPPSTKTKLKKNVIGVV